MKHTGKISDKGNESFQYLFEFQLLEYHCKQHLSIHTLSLSCWTKQLLMTVLVTFFTIIFVLYFYLHFFSYSAY